MKIVFTDIDGTLLDHNTYSYKESLEGISLLKENNIPLIPVSSKTEPEIKNIHSELQLTDPFIFENGAGIAYYTGKSNSKSDFEINIMGMDVNGLKKSFQILKKLLNRPVKTIINMDIDEIVKRTGLTREKAENAVKRRASLPFVFLDDIDFGIDRINDINKNLKKHKLVMTKGGRFYHFSSTGANKGSAINTILDHYKNKYRTDKFFTMGIGDSENDISMLISVDKPFQVKKHDGSYIKTGLENISRTRGIGPSGFTEAVKIFLD